MTCYRRKYEDDAAEVSRIGCEVMASPQLVGQVTDTIGPQSPIFARCKIKVPNLFYLLLGIQALIPSRGKVRKGKLEI